MRSKCTVGSRALAPCYLSAASDAPRPPQQLILCEHGRLQSLFALRNHRSAQTLQQGALAGGTGLTLARRKRHPGITPGVRLTRGEGEELRAAYARRHDQMWRREQPNRARERVGHRRVLELGEEHDQTAMLEQRA